MNTYLTNVNLVLADSILPDSSVVIEDGKIAAVNPETVHLQKYAELSLHGALLLPGLVDLHCDVLEKKIEPRPNVHFPIRFAINQADKLFAAAGITTVFHSLSFANEEWGVRNSNLAECIVLEVDDYNQYGLVDNKAHCRYEITDSTSEEALANLIRSDATQLVSFMDHTPGQGQFKDLAAYVMYHSNEYGIAPSEIESLVQEKMDGASDSLARTRNLAKLATAHGIALASHDDDSPERIDLMHKLGVTISEFPVTLEAARKAHELGMTTVLGAPNIVRGLSQSGSVKALDVLHEGVLDCLCSDYYPASLIHALFKLVQEGELQLSDAVAFVTSKPAHAAGLKDRGQIAEGMRADMIAVGFVTDLPVVLYTFSEGRTVYKADYFEYGHHHELALAC